VEGDAAARRHQLELALERLPERPEVLTINDHRGPPAPRLLELGPDQVDLMVLGSHGRGSLASWLIGGVSATVGQLAPWPVLLVTPRMAGPLLAAAVAGA
jgi:nucleotide-binding universal stress UspA family protein